MNKMFTAQITAYKNMDFFFLIGYKHLPGSACLINITTNAQKKKITTVEIVFLFNKSEACKTLEQCCSFS